MRPDYTGMKWYNKPPFNYLRADREHLGWFDGILLIAGILTPWAILIFCIYFTWRHT